MDRRSQNLSIEGVGGDGGGGSGEDQLETVNLGLPKGWRREENTRQSGLSVGRIDVYYVSPDGKKFWTKPQLSRYFGESVDLSNFDFHSGRFTTNLSIKRPKQNTLPIEYRMSENMKDIHAHAESKPMKCDVSLLPPIRQTASIFKQPVTIVKTQKSRVKTDFKHGVQESPRQLFWEKRLQGLRACDPSGAELAPSELPAGIIPAGPRIDSDTVLHSIATALHLATHPITGQSGNREALEKNPGVFINPDQPLIHEIAVNEEDIRAQEEKVSLARKKLEEALKNFYPGSIPRVVMVKEEAESLSLSAIEPAAENGKIKSVGSSINNGLHNYLPPPSQNPHKKLRLSQSHRQGGTAHPRSQRQ